VRDRQSTARTDLSVFSAIRKNFTCAQRAYGACDTWNLSPTQECQRLNGWLDITV